MCKLCSRRGTNFRYYWVLSAQMQSPSATQKACKASFLHWLYAVWELERGATNAYRILYTKVSGGLACELFRRQTYTYTCPFITWKSQSKKTCKKKLYGYTNHLMHGRSWHLSINMQLEILLQRTWCHMQKESIYSAAHMIRAHERRPIEFRFINCMFTRAAKKKKKCAQRTTLLWQAVSW